jgi:hypothetical protein
MDCKNSTTSGFENMHIDNQAEQNHLPLMWRASHGRWVVGGSRKQVVLTTDLLRIVFLKSAVWMLRLLR